MKKLLLLLLLSLAACGAPASPGGAQLAAEGEAYALSLAHGFLDWRWQAPKVLWVNSITTSDGKRLAGATITPYVIHVVRTPKLSDGALLHEITHAAIWQGTGAPDLLHRGGEWPHVSKANAQLAAAGY